MRTTLAQSLVIETADKQRAAGVSPRRPVLLVGWFVSYRVLVTAGPSIDGWLPFWMRAKNALIAEPTVNVLV
jgi:hypothetical protein